MKKYIEAKEEFHDIAENKNITLMMGYFISRYNYDKIDFVLILPYMTERYWYEHPEHPEFDYEKIFRPETAVHIRNKEQDEFFRDWLKSIGKKWSDGSSYDVTVWEQYKSNTTMYPHIAAYSNTDYHNAKGYKIYTYEQVLKGERKMNYSKLSKKSLKEIKNQVEDALKEKESIMGKTISWKKAISLMEKENDCDFKGEFFIDDDNCVSFYLDMGKEDLDYIK